MGEVPLSELLTSLSCSGFISGYKLLLEVVCFLFLRIQCFYYCGVFAVLIFPLSQFRGVI